VGITAHEATITLRIAARGRDEATCLAAIAPTERVIRECLGPLVYGVEDDEVEDAALGAVTTAGLTLASIECGTLGRVAALLTAAHERITAASGPRVGYCGGTVIPAAGSAAVEMAERARRDFGTALGLGIGGPRPGPEGRRVIDIALAGGFGTRQTEHVLGGGPSLLHSRAAKTAVDFVRRSLDAEGDPS
jgi:nicotinamide-nucleotide amidase